MLSGIKMIWRRIANMFGYTTLKSIVGKDVALSGTMIEAINEWKRMLNGQADWITDYVTSLKLEEGICREFADAVLAELETNVNNDKLDKAYQNSIAGLNENLQEGLGLGSFILKPLGPDTAEYVTADKFIPIQFGDDGKPTDVGFLTVRRIGDSDYYTRYEHHYFIDGNLTIENKCYHSQNENDIGIPCDLGVVEEWAQIAPGPVTFPGMTQMDFGYYRNPVKNKVDGSKCGVSIFESAKERIKGADIRKAQLDWEYESGERAIHTDVRALKNEGKGRLSMAKLNKRLYRGLNIDDGKDKELFKEYSPDMRDEAYKRGLEEEKREIEFIVGLSYGDLSDAQEVAKTATEVRTTKIRKYNRVTAIQKNLKGCLEDFVAGLAFYNGLYTSSYEFNCDFKDSILVDEETERLQDRQDVAAGFMQPWEYRAKWYHEDEATAKANLPEQNRVME